MPELGMIAGRKAAALAGLAPYARDSGKRKGKRCIAGGRSCLRTVLYLAAIAAIKWNPVLALFAKRLKDAKNLKGNTMTGFRDSIPPCGGFLPSLRGRSNWPVGSAGADRRSRF